MLGALGPDRYPCVCLRVHRVAAPVPRRERLHPAGEIRPALQAQDRALELCPPGDYTDWAMTRLDRAACLAQGGDAPAAVTYAIETLTGLSAEQRQGIIAVRGRELVRALPGATARQLPSASSKSC